MIERFCEQYPRLSIVVCIAFLLLILGIGGMLDEGALC